MPSLIQAAVLKILAAGDRSGRSLRASLRVRGYTRSAPAFYQLMSGMEDEGLVTGWYAEKMVGGAWIRERWYRC